MDQDAIKSRLAKIEQEHRSLDDMIETLSKSGFNQLQIQRLKKRKLVLKDEKEKLKSHLIPDIIA